MQSVDIIEEVDGEDLERDIGMSPGKALFGGNTTALMNGSMKTKSRYNTFDESL